MVKYQRSSTFTVGVCIIFLFYSAVAICFLIKFKWNFNDSIVFLAFYEYPMYFLIPIACLRIEFDYEKIILYSGFIKLRTFSWLEVCEIGTAHSRGRCMYVDFIYISKRPITSKERSDINKIKLKERKNFITIENRGNLIEEIKKYSKLSYQSLI
ncbi:MAG: hypothetical protein E7L17_07080 [Clostridium sp.]|uniref:hypothetical protein n=1 Tax=Clostridium sp. TaxID=1506 RepID=UPI00290EA593|nr:hypothetical protein [Clostridium sp.]MDU7337859.1 hypothetical protein [Clostridium sp.]